MTSLTLFSSQPGGEILFLLHFPILHRRSICASIAFARPKFHRSIVASHPKMPANHDIRAPMIYTHGRQQAATRRRSSLDGAKRLELRVMFHPEGPTLWELAVQALS